MIKSNFHLLARLRYICLGFSLLHPQASAANPVDQLENMLRLDEFSIVDPPPTSEITPAPPEKIVESELVEPTKHASRSNNYLPLQSYTGIEAEIGLLLSYDNFPKQTSADIPQQVEPTVPQVSFSDLDIPPLAADFDEEIFATDVTNQPPDVKSQGTLPQENAPQATQSQATQSQAKNTYLGRDYKIKIGMLRPSFSQILNYENFYGTPSNYIGLRISKYFWGDEFPIGFGLNIGYFGDRGNASKTPPNSVANGATIELDSTQTTNLTLIPVQLTMTSHWHLFQDLLVFDYWAGFERLVVQESREISKSDTAGGDSAQQTFTNFGSNSGIVMGLGLGMRIDQFERSNRSSLRAMGLGAIYLQPFLEVVRSTSSKMGDFSRNDIGILFSFESI